MASFWPLIVLCRLVCTDCAAYIATRNQDGEALKKVAEDWSREFGAAFAPEDCVCNGCRALAGRVVAYCGQCPIRSCGISNGVENCACWDEYACEQPGGDGGALARCWQRGRR